MLDFDFGRSCWRHTAAEALTLARAHLAFKQDPDALVELKRSWLMKTVPQEDTDLTEDLWDDAMMGRLRLGDLDTRLLPLKCRHAPTLMLHVLLQA